MRRRLLAILVLNLFVILILVLPQVVFAQITGSEPSAADNPDINLKIRGWSKATPTLGENNLIDVSGPTDSKAPQLTTLIADNPSPTITSLYQVNDWNWNSGTTTGPIVADNSNNWGVTLAGFGTDVGQAIQVPVSGYDIGGGYQAVVLYATPTSLTLHYTPDDNVVYGYTVHLENFNVDPALLSQYEQSDAAGRKQLVALPGGFVVGHASGSEVLVSIRDTGAFMDPRAKKDWWAKVSTQTVTQVAKLVDNTTKTSQKSGQPAGTQPFVKYPDESEEPCVYNEGALNQQDPNKPYTYRPPNGAPSRPEMRGDANLNFNIGVKGTHCGQAKSTPINLEEVAPYNLLETPLCKTVGWAGEIQMNYAAPDYGVNFRIPFVQEMADKLAGTWDPEHVNECQMDNTERLSHGLPAKACMASGSSAGDSGSTGSAFVVPKDVSKDPQYNLAVRSEKSVDEPKSLVQYGYEEPPDPQAPQLSSILGTDPTTAGAFASVYRVQEPEGGDSPPWKVSAVGLTSTVGQAVSAPGGGHDIGGGQTQMVLFADSTSITLVNTRDDNPIEGYTTHLQNVAVNPALLASYQNANANGRKNLPTLGAGQAIGRATGSEVVVAIRDTGEFMDPRSKLDWWQNYAGAPSMSEKPFTNVGVTHRGQAGALAQAEASSTIERKTGFLKKVLAPEIQDKLKCDFVNYVKKQGKNSMYAGFTVDGTRLAEIPCPPTVPQIRNQNKADYNTWFTKWGKTWKRLALFPNERATGQLSFMVCDDRKYYINQAYPEVMRLGLAANQMFKLFTAKQNQDSYYSEPNNGDLRDPLNSQKLIGEAPSVTGLNLSFVPELSGRQPLVKTQQSPGLVVVAGNFTGLLRQKISGAALYLSKQLSYGVTAVVPPKWIASVEKLLVQAATDTGNVVSQFECGPALTCSIDVVDPNPNHFVYEIVVARNGKGPPGTYGDIYINPPKDWEAAMRAANQPVGPHVESMTGQELRILSDYPDANTFMPQVRSADELAQFTFTIDCSRLPEGYKCHNVPIQYKGGMGPPETNQPPPACDPATGIGCQCRETATCSYNDPTARAQLGPSDTEIWQYPKNHELLGVDWGPFLQGGYLAPKLVNLTWQIPAWHAGERSSRGKPLPECSIEVPSKAEDRQACSGSQDDAACGAPAGACNEIKGYCGTIICTKVHERVVDVYNSVPFLGSIWTQLAGYSNLYTGVFSTWKAFINPSITGDSQPTPSGCSDNAEVVFDKLGRFVPNPGASQMYFSFDQNFGFGGEYPQFGDFGKSKVTVRQTKPQVGTSSKIAFYRIGGVCNAFKWLTGQNLLPLGIKNPSILGFAGASVGASTDTSSSINGSMGTSFTVVSPTLTPGSNTSAVTPASANISTQIVNQAKAVIVSLPKVETPTVSTVVNAASLVSQPAFASVQNGDQILVYQAAQQVFVYRPTTQTLVATMPTIAFAVRNGGATTAVFEAFAVKLFQLVPNAVIVDRNDAQKHDYAQTIIVDINKNNTVAVNNLAVLLKIKVGILPTREPKPQQSAYLIIVGSDQTTP